MDLLRQVDRNVRAHQLLAEGESVLVAVSGGLDSMVLLGVLHRLAPKHGWKLGVAHFNHQLRGADSRADEQTVRQTADRLGLPFAVGRSRVAAHAKGQGISLEMAARDLRHRFLARAARRLGSRTVALAHHADDQVELFFLRLLRGSGGEGLAGMKWSGPSPASKQTRLIRPLLDLPKSALLAFAAQHKIRFRDDTTNASLDIRRNRIRHELLPLLEREYQPALRQTIPRVMDIVGEEAACATRLAEAWNREFQPGEPSDAGARGAGSGPVPFDQLPVAVQRKAIQLQLRQLGIVADFHTVETLRNTPARACAATPDRAPAGGEPTSAWVLRDVAGRVGLEEAARTAFTDGERPLCLGPGSGKARFAGVEVSWAVVRNRQGVVLGGAGQEFFDADRVGEQVILRHWRPGDRFQPIGMAASVKLQDLFVNQRVPRAWRHQALLAATGSGDIFWVEGLRLAEGFKLTPQTKRCLRWRWKRV